MSKLIPMEEAAKMLGISVEKLNELRSSNEVFGYKDGAAWKFKETELQRAADDLGLSFGSGGDDDDLGDLDDLGDIQGLGDDDDFDLELDDSSQSLLIDDDDDSSAGIGMESGLGSVSSDKTEVNLSEPVEKSDAKAADGTSSDILSLDDDEDSENLIDLSSKSDREKKVDKQSVLKGSDDAELDGEDELILEESSDDLSLEDSGLIDLSEPDGDDALSFGSSDIDLAAEKSSSGSPSDTGADLLDDEPKKTGSPSDTGDLLVADDGDELMLKEDIELDLAESASFESSDLSSIDDSSDLLLEASDSGDELSLEPDSDGISLSPNASGIRVGEEPLELGGSDIDALELPDDDDDIILVDDEADGDAATLMQEDDFNLTPNIETLEEDDPSGSQVVALVESDMFTDDSAATVLGESGFSEASFDGGEVAGEAYYDPDAVDAEGEGVPTGPPEAPYSWMQVASLGAVTLCLFFGMIVAYGTAQNLWMPENEVVNSGVMKWFIDVLGLQ